MSTQTMKAVVFETGGSPEEVLRVRSVARPQPGPDDVIVRIEARPVQPADFMFIGNRYRIKPVWPQVAGLEGAGVVVAVGDDVRIEVGERVAFRYPGTWAEFARVPADRLYAVPQGVGFEAAAQFSLNCITAWALLDEAAVQPGEWLAINAATSGIAKLVHALARERGLRVVGIVRAGKSAPAPLQFPTVRTDATDLAAEVLVATGGDPVAGLLDSVGGESITRLLPALRPGACIVSFGVLGQSPAVMGNADMIYRNLCWRGFGVDHWLSRSGSQRSQMVESLWASVASGSLPLPVRARYPLDEVGRAVADAATGAASGGKVLIVG